MENISAVVQQLKKELERAKREVERYGPEWAVLIPMLTGCYG
jgi:hypothetical protein